LCLFFVVDDKEGKMKYKKIFDIGCNKGDFYEVALSKYAPEMIIAVDANPNMIYESHRPNLKLVNAAISDKDGEDVTLFIDNKQLGVSTISEKWKTESRFAVGSKYLAKQNTQWTEEIGVKTRTLDGLVEEFGEPDFIKIDVEGHELQAIKGLSKVCGVLCFEWTEEGYDDLRDCVDQLLKIGYDEFGVIGFFEEGDVYDGATFSHLGDAHMIEPEQYHNYENFNKIMENICQPDRLISWGMIYAKEKE